VLATAVPAQPEAARELHERFVFGVRGDREHDVVGACTPLQALELTLEQRPAREVREDLARQPRRGHSRLDDDDAIHPDHTAERTPIAALDSRASFLVDLNGKTLLITGGTGSFGRACIRTVLDRFDVDAIRVFSRDELKQSELTETFHDRRLRMLLGDVRDRDRLRLATRGVDVIIHAAALKQVMACEYNPFEAVQTNVLGAENVISAAIDNDVPLTVSLSTDKAVNPVNLYGAAKLCAEKIIAQAGVYSSRSALFASVRYGNVVGSRGSVIPIFQEQAKTGVVTITDERMTRFWITLQEAVEFVLSSLPLIRGGETFVPKIPSMRVTDVADALAPGAERRIIGIRAGEKLHEVLLTEDEARHSVDLGDRYVILPHLASWVSSMPERGEPLPDGFRFASDTNDRWLSEDDLHVMAGSPVA
jgi:UDP-N-acetylglucosamine 4,6-dehydratase/5-epimerase